ncbi:hypothetical protein tb265_27200 [Gemmatimonadetes bacterium T265]|nr:hypothetical protein tb265_27200 [Gemmatimonadetes bacterium T265]
MSAAAEPNGGALPWRVRVAIGGGTRVLRALARTWRVRELGRDGWNARRAVGEATVVALWHGQMLAMLSHHRDLGIAILISEHQDGEIIARIAHAFGCATVRGSTSRGGARALLALAAALRQGTDVAVTPDGPRGPRHTFAPGALVAAQRAAVPVVGMLASVDRAWRLNTWDGFEIPKPFARITIAYTAPFAVPGRTPAEAAGAADAFAGEMHRAAERARRGA